MKRKKVGWIENVGGLCGGNGEKGEVGQHHSEVGPLSLTFCHLLKKGSVIRLNKFYGFFGYSGAFFNLFGQIILEQLKK